MQPPDEYLVTDGGVDGPSGPHERIDACRAGFFIERGDLGPAL
jgi:hypothetical protein